MWFFFALSSALLYSFRAVLEKRVIHNVDKYVLAFALRLFALPFFAIPFIIKPEKFISISHLSLEFWISVCLVALILTPLETILYYKALKYEEISLVIPILTLVPVTTSIMGIFTLKEIPTAWGFLGIVCIVAGIYILKIKHIKDGLLAPFIHLKNNTAVRLMLLVVLSQTLGGIFDKIAINHSDAYIYAFVNYLLLVPSLGILFFLKSKRNVKFFGMYLIPFFILGAVVAGYTVFYYLALQSGFLSYSIAIRSTSIIFTILFGLTILKEQDKLAKIVAGILIFIGVILIKIYG